MPISAPAPVPANAASIVFDYHRRTKHRHDRYATDPETLDWDAQPDPYRTFAGCPRTMLPLVSDTIMAPYAALTGEVPVTPALLSIQSVSALLELSFGLSAWKEYGPDRWAVRCNPSSGNLHPTEAYVLAQDIPGLADGIHHYDSRDHVLEQRCATSFSGGGLWIGLSSIHWREAWKYGERAFRYCQLDIGHALGAIRFAAAALGWRVTLLDRLDTAAIAALIGTDRDADFSGAEREEAELLLAIETAPGTEAMTPEPAHGGIWQGAANLLDPHPMYRWPVIDEVAEASRGAAVGETTGTANDAFGALLPAPEGRAAEFILNRRSAQRYDRKFVMPIAAFARILDACQPRRVEDGMSGNIQLVAFVHSVEGLEPGIYALPRASGAEAKLRAGLDPIFSWEPVSALPSSIPLKRLIKADCRKVVRALTCHQAITADGCVTFCLLSDFAPLVEENPWRYRQLHWQAGMLGQTLYLEAQAAGLSGTGIGCFLDDEIHRLLGIGTERFQALYHFTIGAGVGDPRITDHPAYAGRHRAEASVYLA